ncbi:EAL domain-containing protein [Arthrobacter sp. CJ23]|uniref:EAL domain-containing protein n=1 Tax=Arthrobacter sp. CJ23 TaxID=2972479 RepID=UPI00215CF018|nr:EAL domain-containing protein [Arthrobacter sp. CJ23]UVJ39412.1 EAL domain-containing protein [Arthrobacter sp. CJ23]
MPVDKSPTPSTNAGHGLRPADGPTTPPADRDLTALQKQAGEIIESVLAQSNAKGAPLRERLRATVAAHPGDPVTALREHLIYTRTLPPEGAETAALSAPGPSRVALRPEVPDPAAPTGHDADDDLSRSRIEAVLDQGMLLTAFQPIHDLGSGQAAGVEALSRFVSDDGESADHWFANAASVGLGADLEFAALASALKTAEELPAHLFVSLNVSPALCLDSRLPYVLEQSPLAIERIVLDMTESLAPDDPAPLVAALAPLREQGLRIAVDEAAAGPSFMRAILVLRPDFIKLDHHLIVEFDDETDKETPAAIVKFAKQIGAVLVAQGIETAEDLAAVAGLGITAGQGYFLGRPSIQPRDWDLWQDSSEPSSDSARPSGEEMEQVLPPS